MLYDLTEIRRLEAMRRDFVANVSHELKTPLTVVQSYLEILTTDLDDALGRTRWIVSADRGLDPQLRVGGSCPTCDDVGGPTRVTGGYAAWPPPHREGVGVLASTLSG